MMTFCKAIDYNHMRNRVLCVRIHPSILLIPSYGTSVLLYLNQFHSLQIYLNQFGFPLQDKSGKCQLSFSIHLDRGDGWLMYPSPFTSPGWRCATGASIRLHFLGAPLVSRVEFQPSSPNLSEEAHPLSIWKQMKREKQKPKKTEMASAGVAKPFNTMVGSFSSVRV